VPNAAQHVSVEVRMKFKFSFHPEELSFLKGLIADLFELMRAHTGFCVFKLIFSLYDEKTYELNLSL
jgi:hypothetical protein